MVYEIYERDLKFRHKRDLNIDKIILTNISKDNYSIDHDSIGYRIKECEDSGFTMLDLSEMYLETIPDLPQEISKNVKNLFLSNNKFKGVLNLCIFKSLEVVDFSHNLVETFKYGEGVEEICCKDNSLKSFDIKNSLKRLDCSKNLLTTLNLNSNSNLNILICSENSIEHIGDCPSLIKLVCNNNPIKTIGKMNNLKNLDIGHTLINDINNFDNLENLYCNNTLITVLPTFKNLKELDVIGSNIAIIEYMQNLKYIICEITKTKSISNKYNIENIKIHKGIFLVINLI